MLVLKLESRIKDLLFVKGGEQEKPLLVFVKMKHESAGRKKARQLQITVRRARTTWGSASTETRRIKMFYLWIADNCNWVDQVEVPISHWKLKRFSTWLKMQSVFQVTYLENNMTEEQMTKTHQTARGGKKLFAVM